MVMMAHNKREENFYGSSFPRAKRQSIEARSLCPEPPTLPSTRWIGITNNNDKAKEERRDGLETYLRSK